MSNDIIFSYKLIREDKLTLDGWLQLMNSDDRRRLLPNNCFPTDEFLDQYIDRINEFNDKEFKNLLRMLMVNPRGYETDKERELICLERGLEEYPNEYYRRLSETAYPYEGITWMLDVISYSPRAALEILNAYNAVHFMYLPDNSVSGLLDAQVLIRARYLQNDYSIDSLLTLSSLEFERLIAKLYRKIGYEVKLTKSTRDGGKDIIAENKTIGRKELLFIECKRYKNKVGIDHIRKLLGVVIDQKVTKGILIGASGFSRDAMNFANKNSNLELIGGQELLNLLDEYLGKNWFNFIPKYMK
ncbi:restriction endonuclease [Priestia megaterium]|uniref:restriction endonuclease n=1 Tax=Priestia megaterium TaxID=1404 RepID=UPI0035B64957